MFALFSEVWSSLVTWLVGLFSQIEPIFVKTTGEGSSSTKSLTFIGVCAVVMAGVSLILLVFNLIRSFVTMRG